MKRSTVFGLALAWLVCPLPLLAATPGFKAPPRDRLKVAVVMTEGATMIDFAGPWEVFQDVHVPGRGESMEEMMPFELFTVGAARTPIKASGGMTVVPDYTFGDAPAADIVVLGAQKGGPALSGWLKKAHDRNAVIMSVCTGAFLLADAGLLDGREATTHHHAYDLLVQQHPKVKVVRSKRWVQSGPRTFTSGGLSSGIDLALHLVALYFGDAVAEKTADHMEYHGTGWRTGEVPTSRASAR
jgi:transcriptional regulator GlxA family with amidase domain